MTREDVSALAHLARIALNEEELSRAEKELENVLKFVNRLQKVPTDGVEEAAPAAVVASGFRQDKAIQSSSETLQLIVQNFPSKQGGLLKAPAVFERPKK